LLELDAGAGRQSGDRFLQLRLQLLDVVRAEVRFHRYSLQRDDGVKHTASPATLVASVDDNARVCAMQISPSLREGLDDVPVAVIAEYLCERLDLGDGDHGRRVLELVFLDGRYQRGRLV